jgi:hypothetical protein
MNFDPNQCVYVMIDVDDIQHESHEFLHENAWLVMPRLGDDFKEKTIAPTGYAIHAQSGNPWWSHPRSWLAERSA